MQVKIFMNILERGETWQQAISGVIPLAKEIIKIDHVELAFR